MTSETEEGACYDHSLFSEPNAIDVNLFCPIGFGVLKQPRRTPCGHVFCRGCLIRWLARDKRCPECRARVSEIKTDRVLVNICDNLAVTCPNMCGWEGRLGNFDAHQCPLTTCQDESGVKRPSAISTVLPALQTTSGILGQSNQPTLDISPNIPSVVDAPQNSSVDRTSPSPRPASAGVSPNISSPDSSSSASISPISQPSSAVGSGRSVDLESVARPSQDNTTSHPTEERSAALAAMSPEDRAAALAAMSAEERAAALAAMSPEERAAALAVMLPEERAAAMAAISSGARATYSVVPYPVATNQESEALQQRRKRRMERERRRSHEAHGNRNGGRHGVRKVVVALLFLAAVWLGQWVHNSNSNSRGPNTRHTTERTLVVKAPHSLKQHTPGQSKADECVRHLGESRRIHQACKHHITSVEVASQQVRGRFPLQVDSHCGSTGSCRAGWALSGPVQGRAAQTVFESIAPAVAAAADGDTIVVGCGTYKDGGAITIQKNVHLVAAKGCRQKPVLEAFTSSVVVFDTPYGSIQGLDLMQRGGHCKEGYPCSITGQALPAVEIRQGALVLQHCRVGSLHGGGIRVSGAARPTLMHNEIGPAALYGILVTAKAGGMVYHNDIHHVGHVGVQIQEGAWPVLTRNIIRDGNESGIVICDSGRGSVDDNQVSNHGLSSIEVDTKGSAHIARNVVRKSGQAGVFVHSQGHGRIEDNDISESQFGIEVASGATPVLQGNQVKRCRGPGILIQKGGSGLVQHNNITRMYPSSQGVVVQPGGAARVMDNTVTTP